MASIYFEGIENLIRLERDLGALKEAAKPVMRAALTKTLIDITADAKVLAPFDTGALSESISYEMTETATGVSGDVGPGQSYGIYLEYGTSRMAPQPYMTPAYDRRVPGFEAALAQIVDRFKA